MPMVIAIMILGEAVPWIFISGTATQLAKSFGSFTV